MGESNHGIVGYHNNTGDIRIDANNVGITTESTELYSGSFYPRPRHLRSASGHRRR